MDGAYDTFRGTLVVVDLATQVQVNGKAELFPGRQWLEEQLREKRTIAFGCIWKADRAAGSDNPIALLQFAGGDMVVLLRTHLTRDWLPQVVKDLMTSCCVRKLCIGQDVTTRKKIASLFRLQLKNAIDVQAVAHRKGYPCCGLRSLAEDFHWNLRLDYGLLRSDWEAERLNDEQIRHAADHVAFTMTVFECLERIDDPQDPGADVSLTEEEPTKWTVLTLRPGWAAQGVVKRSDGLWCESCNKGPMVHSEVMEKHLESKMHVKKVFGKASTERVFEEVPEELALRGIRASKGAHPRIPSGQYYCAFCDAGPFTILSQVESHLQGNKHLRKEGYRPGSSSDRERGQRRGQWGIISVLRK